MASAVRGIALHASSSHTPRHTRRAGPVRASSTHSARQTARRATRHTAPHCASIGAGERSEVVVASAHLLVGHARAGEFLERGARRWVCGRDEPERVVWHEDNEEGQQPEGDLQHGVGVDEAVDEDERDEDNEVGREARSEIELERREGGALLAERPLPRGEVLREERGGAVGRPDHLCAGERVVDGGRRVGLERRDAALDLLVLLGRDDGATDGKDGEEAGEARQAEHEEGGDELDAVVLLGARHHGRLGLVEERRADGAVTRVTNRPGADPPRVVTDHLLA
mmetsp:Transcript_61138/g.167720  ORF Transcript_61138/g.167720 Transcript_61138/m.167720 type:complete len:283 (-) Transcript_61138:1313-2161(-)